MTLRRILRIGLNVADLDVTERFYVEALGFSKIGQRDDSELARLLGVRRVRTRTLRLGGQSVELARCEPAGLAYPADSTSADNWFQHFAIVGPDIATTFERLRRHGCAAITRGGPQTLPAASGGAAAYKFRDPDGHPLELIQFPGPARAAGIDHSAIGVANAELSIAFYRQWGVSLAARQVNTGPEQDRLDGLQDASVEVVALHPAQSSTPHIELLAYRAPRGRAMLLDAPDIAATRLVLEGDTRGGKTELVIDPDGHALQVVPDAVTPMQ